MIIYIILIIVIINFFFKKESFCQDIEKLNNNNLYDVPLISPYIYDDAYIEETKNDFIIHKNELKDYFKKLKKC